MKITRRPPTGVPGAGPTGAVADVSAAPEVGGGRPTDRVDVSEAARLRLHLRAALGALDGTTVGPERLTALRQQVERGGYQPAPRAVAERLLGESAADLLV